MQRKLAENQAKKEGGSVSAPDLTCDLSAAGELLDADRSDDEDSVMSSCDSQDGDEQTPRSASNNLQII